MIDAGSKYAMPMLVAVFKKCTLASSRQQKNNAAHNEFVVERLLYLQYYLPCINLHVPDIFHSNQRSDGLKKQLVKDYKILYFFDRLPMKIYEPLRPTICL